MAVRKYLLRSKTSFGLDYRPPTRLDDEFYYDSLVEKALSQGRTQKRALDEMIQSLGDPPTRPLGSVFEVLGPGGSTYVFCTVNFQLECVTCGWHAESIRVGLRMVLDLCELVVMGVCVIRTFL
jgi:hypothetical protein